MTSDEIEPETITVTINSEEYEREVEPRRLLSDFIREEVGLTGTHVGCEHGACGMCTILMDGESIRSCLMFAVQADGAEIETVENLGTVNDMHPIQEAFHENHGLQCGFCTPGMLLSTKELLKENPDPDREAIKETLGANICRCTGYAPIIESVEAAAELVQVPMEKREEDLSTTGDD